MNGIIKPFFDLLLNEKLMASALVIFLLSTTLGRTLGMAIADPGFRMGDMWLRLLRLSLMAAVFWLVGYYGTILIKRWMGMK